MLAEPHLKTYQKQTLHNCVAIQLTSDDKALFVIKHARGQSCIGKGCILYITKCTTIMVIFLIPNYKCLDIGVSLLLIFLVETAKGHKGVGQCLRNMLKNNFIVHTAL